MNSSKIAQHIETLNKLKIYTNTTVNVGSYNFLVKATIIGTTISNTKTIILTIKDECTH
jgi:hypothetical protein